VLRASFLETCFVLGANFNGRKKGGWVGRDLGWELDGEVEVRCIENCTVTSEIWPY
jgi:hypothetical protein